MNGLAELADTLEHEKFCMLRAPIWSTSAYSATSRSVSESLTSVMTGAWSPPCLGEDLETFFFQPLKIVRAGAA